MKYYEQKIFEWKRKYGDIYEIKVDDKSCIIRAVDRKVLSFASVNTDSIKASETILNELWIAGDEEMRTNDQLFLATINQMQEIMKVKEGSIQKL